jgi:tetraacyldisaccharide 4'-kinase
MLEWLLTPPSWLYAAAVARRQQRTGLRLSIPVISIGGATLGGSGKTPAVRAVRARLRLLGVEAATLSRGHGGRLRGPVQVDAARHSAHEVGDEPLLHARDGPAWIARDRAEGALAAAHAGAQALLLDDAHQNPSLVKDLRILMLDGAEGLGNGRVFPAGPLREPLAQALARADCVFAPEGATVPPTPVPVLRTRLTAAAAPPCGPLVAFAGIAFPERFAASLAQAGGEVAELAPFPDHHAYSEGDLRLLARLAQERGASLVTTEKDHVRLSPPWRTRAAAFGVRLHLCDPEPLDALLLGALERGR